MKKATHFVCESCGYESLKWFGRCPSCGAWNTARQVTHVESERRRDVVEPVSLTGIITETKSERIRTGFSELDEALSGGFLPGQVVLLGGEPGVGKSSLALQISCHLASMFKVLYVTAEESAEQVGYRATRFDCRFKGNVVVLSENDPQAVLNTLDNSYRFLVVDSLQAMYSEQVGAYPGSVAQVRTAASLITERCKQLSIPALLIAHITKSGEIAGPKMVEHLVDTVIYFEGETNTDFRVLRVVKNRFGPSGEMCIFEMTELGLKQIDESFLIDIEEPPAGNCFSCVIEGSKPLVVQLQALVSKARSVSPRRVSNGYHSGTTNSSSFGESRRVCERHGRFENNRHSCGSGRGLCHRFFSDRDLSRKNCGLRRDQFGWEGQTCSQDQKPTRRAEQGRVGKDTVARGLGSRQWFSHTERCEISFGRFGSEEV